VCIYTGAKKGNGNGTESEHAAARKGATAASDPMRKTDIVV
jgi:hypothetical protein